MTKMCSYFLSLASYFNDLVLVYSFGAVFLIKQIIFTVIYFRKGCSIDKNEKLHGKTVLITGGSGGIGSELVKLLKHGNKVILGIPNFQNIGNKDTFINSSVHSYDLDLSSMKSVKNFVSKVKLEHRHIDVIIHCAGVMFHDQAKTEDGCDYQFSVNYLGPVLLTLLLLPIMKADSNSSLVFLSSCEHFASSEKHLKTLPYFSSNSDSIYSAHGMYAWSKLAIILFAYSLHRKLSWKDKNMKIVCLHPGIINTNLYQNVWWTSLFPVLPQLFFHTAKTGACNVLDAMYAANDADSCYYWSDGFVTSSSHVSYDASVQEQIWDKSMNVLSEFLNLDNKLGF